MLAKVAAAAGGVALGAMVLGNRPPMPHNSYVVAVLALLALLLLAYRAGKHDRPEAIEARAKAKASARSRSQAAATGGQAAVHVNLGQQATVIDPALVEALAARLRAPAPALDLDPAPALPAAAMPCQFRPGSACIAGCDPRVACWRDVMADAVDDGHLPAHTD